MTCGCSGGPCWKQRFLNATNARMSADGSTAAGYMAHDLLYRMGNAEWIAAVGSLGTGFPGQQPAVGFSAQKLSCYLGAMIDLYDALRLCNAISDPTARQTCIDNAEANYGDAIDACDAA